MHLKAWAYLAATLAMAAGAYVTFGKRQWKYGAWIICFALAVFFGGSLNIGNLQEFSDAFKFTQQIAGITNDVQRLKVQVNQTVEMKQHVSQTVNVITEVKKEIANIREAVDQLYAMSRGETFKKADMGKRVRVFGTTRGVAHVYLQLAEMPVPQSVGVSYQLGAVSPETYEPYQNVVIFRTRERTNALLADDAAFYHVRYVANPAATNDLLSLEGMEWNEATNGLVSERFRRVKKP